MKIVIAILMIIILGLVVFCLGEITITIEPNIAIPSDRYVINEQKLLGSLNTFPTTLNDWEAGDTIESDWMDSLENKIGVDGSTVVTSLDYLIKNSSSTLYRIDKTDGGFVVGNGTTWVLESGSTARDSLGLPGLYTTWANATTILNRYIASSTLPEGRILLGNNADMAESTTTLFISADTGYTGISSTTPTEMLSVAGNIMSSGNIVLYGSSTSTFGGGIIVAESLRATNGLIGTLTGNVIGNADTATALAANGANCSIGYYPLGIDASGAVENCTILPISSNWKFLTGSQNALMASTTGIGIFTGETASTTLQGDTTIGKTTTLFVDSDGYIGIATSTPSEEFAVGGDIYITGDFNTPHGEVVDFQEKCLTMSSSTWNGMGTTTTLWYPNQAITVFKMTCIGKKDTAGTTTIAFGDGTNFADTLTCGETLSTDSSLSNNTWNAAEDFTWILRSANQGTPQRFTACVYYYIDKD